MKVIIHIGMHKAASSSIQAFARVNRGLLERYGVVVPRFRHRGLVYDVFDYEGFTPLKNYDKQRHKKVWMRKIQDIYADNDAKQRSKIIFLSSETFENYAGNLRKFSKLLDWLSSFATEVEFMVVIRDQASFLNSQYCQIAKSLGTADDFDAFLLKSLKWKKLDYTRRFKAVLGAKQKIIAIPFSGLATQGVPKQLVGKVFGIEGQAIYDELETPDKRNPSPGIKTVAAAVKIRGRIDERLNGRNFPEQIRHKLKRKLSRVSGELGWNATRFSGLDSEKARAITASFAKRNNIFAQAVWRADWSEMYQQRDDFSVCTFDFAKADRNEQEEFEEVIESLLQRFDKLMRKRQGNSGSHAKREPANPA